LNGAQLFKVEVNEGTLKTRQNIFREDPMSITETVLPSTKVKPKRVVASPSPKYGLNKDRKKEHSVDILEDFKNYDEVLFKDNLQE